MKRLVQQRVPLAILIAVLLAALPSLATPAPKPRPAKVVLPSWAPKKPSQEFLRAAKVLKPIPEEVQAYDPLYPAAWEFFGGLDEKQTAAFLRWTQHSLPLSTTSERVTRFWKDNAGAREVGDQLVYRIHEVYLPFGSLTRRQRQLFDGVAKSWPNPEKKERTDLLVQLYRAGARKDLSNVKVGFNTAGHRVSFSWEVQVTTGYRNSSIAYAEDIAYL